MLLQGNLQLVFDALYSLGVIDPVLELDWVEEMERVGQYRTDLVKAVDVANQFQRSTDDLKAHLGQFDSKVLGYLAMEVAREFADYHAREDVH